MKRSGKTNRAEPSDMTCVQIFPNYARLSVEAGWLSFFERIEGYHTEVSYKFPQCLDNDIVTFVRQDVVILSNFATQVYYIGIASSA